MPRFRSLLLLFCCFISFGARAQECALDRVEFEFPDTRQAKLLQLAATAPRTGSALGIIVISHGFSDQKESNQPLVRPLACDGWLVLQPNHLDSRVFPGDPRRPGLWWTRALDITHVLDRVGEIERRMPGLSGRVDHARIAVLGHSFGAFTAQLVAGVTMRVGERAISFRDARIRAAVLLAPLGAWRVFEPAAWNDLQIPLLEIQGGLDSPPPADQPRRNLVPYDRTNVPGTALLLFPQAGHHFGDIYGRGDVGAETDPRVVAAVVRSVIGWLDETVKEQAGAFDRAYAEIDRRWPGLADLSRK